MKLLKKTVAAALTLLMLAALLPASALAAETESVLILPEDLKRIEDLAFTRVEADTVRFPDGIEFIADNAFGTSIKTWHGSWNNTVVRTWCDEHGWTWEPEHCYALIIGNSIYDYLGSLSSVPNDALAMSNALHRTKGDWQVTVLANATVEQIHDAIGRAFARATEEDLCLFYFSGHGDDSDRDTAGSIMGTDSVVGAEEFGMKDYVITPAELRDWLSDAAPGPVTVLIDACGSGAMIYEHYQGMPDNDFGDAETFDSGDTPKLDPDNFNRAFVSAFSHPSSFVGFRGGELRNPEKFSVLTACAYNEISMGTYLTDELVQYNIELVLEFPEILDVDDFEISYQGGAFTYALMQSIGLQYPTCAPDSSLSADANRDGLLTLSEVYLNVSRILEHIDELWRAFIDACREVRTDEELSPNHPIQETYDLHSQTPRFAGFGGNVLFWLPDT